MSTILRALRRLEEEKSEATQRPLRDDVVIADLQGGRRARPLRAVAIAAACSAGLVVALWLGWSSGGPVEQALSPSSAPDRGAPSETPALLEPQAPGQGAPSAASPSSAAALPPGSSNLRLEAPEPVPERAFQRPEERATLQPRARPQPAKPAEVRREPAAAPREPARAAEPVAPRGPQPGAPQRAEASGSAWSDPIPSPALVVAQTVWHPDAERRLAVVEVEGREEPLRLREGDAVGPLVVLKIEPRGVLFLRGSVEVLHPVGGPR